MFVFLVNPCLVVAVQLCMEWIPIKKNQRNIKSVWCYLLPPKIKALLKILTRLQEFSEVFLKHKAQKPGSQDFSRKIFSSEHQCRILTKVPLEDGLTLSYLEFFFVFNLKEATLSSEKGSISVKYIVVAE